MENLRKLKTFIAINRRPGKKPYSFRHLSALVSIYEQPGLNMTKVAKLSDIGGSQIIKNLDVLKERGHIIIKDSGEGHEYACFITPDGKEFLQQLCEVFRP